eukprot:gene7104-11267_t
MFTETKELILHSNRYDNILFIIEDNFYYKSMRNVYFKFCRKQEISYGELYLKSSLEICQKRNVSREIKVPESTINEMYLKFEYPNKNEKYKFLILDNDNFNLNITLIDDFILKLFENPLIDDFSKEIEMKEQDRIKTTKNEIHNVDLILRKLVSEKMKTCSKNKKEVSAKLNEIRKEMMQRLKSNEINSEEIESVTKTKMGELLDKTKDLSEKI